MDIQDTNPGSSAQLDNLPPVSTQSAPSHLIGPELKEFIWRHCDPIYISIARLTGISDSNDLEYLTCQVILDLWDHRGALLKEQRPGVFIFKILLRHTFNHLKRAGSTSRIGVLRNILLIDRVCYLHVIKPEERSTQPNFLSFLLHQIKRIWKTY